MDLSFVRDKKWRELSQDTKNDVLRFVFREEIESDKLWGGLPKETQNEVRRVYYDIVAREEYLQKIEEAPKSRSRAGRIASGLARGVVTGIVEPVGHLIDAVGGEDDGGILDRAGKSIIDWSQKTVEETPFLRKDKGQLRGEESLVGRGVTGTAEGIPATLPIIGTAIAGAKLGAFSPAPQITIPAGAAIGSLVGLVSMFGPSTYGRAYTEVMNELDQTRPDLSPEERKEVATRTALTEAAFEVGTEIPETLLALRMVGGAKVITDPLKATLRQAVGLRTRAKDFALAAGGGVAGEMTAAAGQVWARQREGLASPDMSEAVIESIIPSLGISLFYGAASAGYNASQERAMMKALNSDNLDVRMKAVRDTAQRLKANTQDEDLAMLWHNTALLSISKGEKFDFNQGIVDFAKTKVAEEYEQSNTVSGRNVDELIQDFVQKTQYAGDAGIGVTLADISKMSLAERMKLVETSVMPQTERPTTPEEERTLQNAELYEALSDRQIIPEETLNYRGLAAQDRPVAATELTEDMYHVPVAPTYEADQYERAARYYPSGLPHARMDMSAMAKLFEEVAQRRTAAQSVAQTQAAMPETTEPLVPDTPVPEKPKWKTKTTAGIKQHIYEEGDIALTIRDTKKDTGGYVLYLKDRKTHIGKFDDLASAKAAAKRRVRAIKALAKPTAEEQVATEPAAEPAAIPTPKPETAAMPEAAAMPSVVAQEQAVMTEVSPQQTPTPAPIVATAPTATPRPAITPIPVATPAFVATPATVTIPEQLVAPMPPATPSQVVTPRPAMPPAAPKPKQTAAAKTKEEPKESAETRAIIDAIKSVPDLPSMPLGGWTVTSERTFDKLGERVKELTYRKATAAVASARRQSNEIQAQSEIIQSRANVDAKKTTKPIIGVDGEKVEETIKEYKKLLASDASVRIGAYAIAQQKDGMDTLIDMGIGEIPVLTKAEKEAYDWQRSILEDLYKKIQAARQEAGVEEMGYVDNYFTFARQLQSAMDAGKNPLTDKSLSQYIGVQKPATDKKPAPFFKHAITRTQNTQPLDLDAFTVFNKYVAAANEHLALFPHLNALGNAIGKPDKAAKKPAGRDTHDDIDADMYDDAFDDGDDTGDSPSVRATTRGIKRKELKELEATHPNALKFLNTWLDHQRGIRKTVFPERVDNALRILNHNLIYAILAYNVRSAIIQPSALINTATQLGTQWTMEGISELYQGGGQMAMEKSNELITRVMDSHVYDAITGAVGSFGRAQQKIGKYGFVALQELDLITAKATWLGAYRKAQSEGMAEDKAINYADDMVVRTQGSAAPANISPMQMTTLGKTITTFQTFVINQWGFLTYDVMGIGNAKISNKEVFRKACTFVAATMLTNMFFEDILGLNSPMPTPIRDAVEAYKKQHSMVDAGRMAAAEMATLIPVVGGGFRYGSSPIGATVGFAADVAQKLAPGQTGIEKSWAELSGKAMGIPGAQQIIKSVKAIKRDGSIDDIILGRPIKTIEEEWRIYKKPYKDVYDAWREAGDKKTFFDDNKEEIVKYKQIMRVQQKLSELKQEKNVLEKKLEKGQGDAKMIEQRLGQIDDISNKLMTDFME